LKALQKIEKMNEKYNYDVFNLGTGHGYSVVQVLEEFQKAYGK
jgi:UDP-glucose 4-epimerase